MSTPEPLTIPHQLQAVTSCLEEQIESIALGNEQLQDAALQAAKYIFDLSLAVESESKGPVDNLLVSLNPLQAPQTRSQAKSSGQILRSPVLHEFEPTPLSSLLIEGIDSEQIWMQLDLRAHAVCNLLDHALEGGPGKEDEEGESLNEEEESNLSEVIESLGIDVDTLRAELNEEMDLEDDSGTSESGESGELGDSTQEDEEDIVHLRSSDEEHSDLESGNTLLDFIRPNKLSKNKGSRGLDDGFFELDAFNAETERAEARSSSRGHLADSSDDSDDSASSVDLFAPVEDQLDDGRDTGGVFYRDYFEPPRTSVSTAQHRRSKVRGTPVGGGRVRFHDQVRVKKIKAKGKNLPLRLMYEMDDSDEDDEGDDEPDGGIDFLGENEDGDSELGLEDNELAAESDVEMSAVESSLGDQDSETEDTRNIIERLKDDLFAEDVEPAIEDGVTSHEKRQKALRQQIAQLEAENVATKDWVLSGEAGSRSRPQNSLLEEDLEFERVMKPVPVISEEVVQGLEQRIRERILENRFDDVVRIRPLEDKPFLPSHLLELQDTKSTLSLAQVYENDYVASQGGLVDDRDGKVRKEHEEIEQEWEKICNKLDALCNAHFTPKQPKTVISTLSNVATTLVESALPVTRAASTVLAPEEIFNPVSSETRSRSELTPAEKRTLRAKERKAKRKQRETLEKKIGKVSKAKALKGKGSIKKEKQAALQSIVKVGKGVTVVGKPGGVASTKRQKRA